MLLLRAKVAWAIELALGAAAPAEVDALADIFGRGGREEEARVRRRR